MAVCLDLQLDALFDGLERPVLLQCEVTSELDHGFVDGYLCGSAQKSCK